MKEAKRTDSELCEASRRRERRKPREPTLICVKRAGRERERRKPREPTLICVKRAGGERVKEAKRTDSDLCEASRRREREGSQENRL